MLEGKKLAPRVKCASCGNVILEGEGRYQTLEGSYCPGCEPRAVVEVYRLIFFGKSHNQTSTGLWG